MAKTRDEQIPDKLRMHIRAYDSKLIDNACRQIVDTVKRLDATIIGPTPLPREVRKYTVNRSTFVHKNSRDQFEIRVHKRLIDILNPRPDVISSLSNLNLPSGVDIEIKMM